MFVNDSECLSPFLFAMFVNDIEDFFYVHRAVGYRVVSPASRFACESFRPMVISPWVISPWVVSPASRFAPI